VGKVEVIILTRGARGEEEKEKVGDQGLPVEKRLGQEDLFKEASELFKSKG